MMCPRCGYDNLPGIFTCNRCLYDMAELDVPCAHDRVESSLLTLKVEVLKPRRPVTVQQDTPLCETMSLMREQAVGAVLVVDDNEKLVGILTERDLLMRAADRLTNGLASHPAVEFMTANPTTVTNGDSLARALHKLDAGRYRHLPVVDNGKPVGVISVRDLLRCITRLCKE